MHPTDGLAELTADLVAIGVIILVLGIPYAIHVLNTLDGVLKSKYSIFEHLDLSDWRDEADVFDRLLEGGKKKGLFIPRSFWRGYIHWSLWRFERKKLVTRERLRIRDEHVGRKPPWVYRTTPDGQDRFARMKQKERDLERAAQVKLLERRRRQRT